MDKVFTPRHTPHPLFEVQLHESCGHVTWRQRVEILPEGAIPTIPKYLPLGRPLCAACQMAQEKPELSAARLVGSGMLQRITAIGFGVKRKDELKALKFVWRPTESLWVFPSSVSTLQEEAGRLADALGCPSEVNRSLTIPPVPESSCSLPEVRVPKLAVIACPIGNKHIFLTPHSRNNQVLLGTVPWPPDLSALPDVSSIGLPPHVPRRLALPPVEDLATKGFTREDLLALINAAGDLGVTVTIVGDEFPTKPLQDVLAKLPHRTPVSHPLNQDRSQSKGGRPRTASLHRDEMVRRYHQGQSLSSIARDLGCSPRSVGRLVSGSIPPNEP